MQSDGESNVITNHMLTNQSDCKDTSDSNRSRPGTPEIHEGCAEDGNNYVYRTPNLLEHDNQNNQEDHETHPPQLWPTPSGKTPEPPPYPDPSEALEKSSLPPASLSSPLKKDNIKPDALLMNTERPSQSWNLCLAPAKKNSRFKPEEELEMREGIGLMRGAVSPCLEFGRGTGTGATQPDQMELEAKPPLLVNPSAL